jgi:hypothetical protein
MGTDVAICGDISLSRRISMHHGTARAKARGIRGSRGSREHWARILEKIKDVPKLAFPSIDYKHTDDPQCSVDEVMLSFTHCSLTMAKCIKSATFVWRFPQSWKASTEQS